MSTDEPVSTFTRIAYINARRSLGSDRAAFERTVSVLRHRLPMLTAEAARQHVARGAAAALSPAGEETTLPTAQ